ncbi:MAG: hypothetical protein JSR53_09410 [Proteobacteria bacterium]|nr:hypothetical protein [Pseudomonadota bacterium]
MAFKLVERNSVAVQVKGEITGDKGAGEPFNFTLHCKRMGVEALQEQLKDESRSVRDFLVGIAHGWAGVNDADGAALPFAPDALGALLDIPGIAGLAFSAYLEQQGARAKN